MTGRRPRGARLRWACLLGAAGLVSALAACGGSSPATSTGSGHASAHGPVRVLFAASLQDAFDKGVGPAFDKATGYTFTGYPGPSKALANEVTGKVYRGDVFVSASPDVDATLQKAGDLSWYAVFGTTSLVLAYNPHSKFAAAFRSKPWYRVLEEPGIRIGRTDPTLDPKGVLTLAALQAAQSDYHLPGFAARITKRSLVFPEQDLVGRLEAGQLDVGFYYRLETAAAHLHAVSLGEATQRTTFTVGVLRNAPDPAAAVAFVRYLLGPARSEMATDGFAPQAPVRHGQLSAVPRALRSLLASGA